MPWYSSRNGEKRLKFESGLMKKHFPQYTLYVDDYDDLFWSGSVNFYDLRRRHKDVRLVYSSNHPDVPMDVYVAKPTLNPKVSHHILDDGRKICYIKDSDWRYKYTAATVAGMTIRFLREYWTGRLDP